MKSGDILSFNYIDANRDNNPLILIVDVSDKYIRGINLHYLPIEKASDAIRKNAGQTFADGYRSISNVLRPAFRMYKKSSMKNKKLLNWDKLTQKINSLARMNPIAKNELKSRIDKHLASGGKADYVPSIIRSAINNPESL